MTIVYFDVTDIVSFAARYSRVTGIQRVQLNIITLLARKYGGATVRCTFFDAVKRTMVEFDPAQLSANDEFDAESFLADIGLAAPLSRFPSKAQVKSHLRRYNNRKWQRALKKIDIYWSAMFAPSRLAAQGFSLAKLSAVARPGVTLRECKALPDSSSYVCLGSVWLHPEVLAFGRQHSERGQDVVQMVYDLIPIVHPEYYGPKEVQAYATWLNDAFTYVSRFICISNWTAADLLKYAVAQGHRPVAQAIPLAHEFFGFDRTSRVDASPEPSLLGKRYVLCVGTIESRKNGLALLQAWEKLSVELGERMPLLVFAGKYGKGSEQFQQLLAKNVKLAQRVRVIHAPSDRELAWLYLNCLFTAFPSTYEGWGLPVGESVWFGKYCVASSATSVPEVCGDLLDYVDVETLGSLCAGLSAPIVNDDFLRDKEQAIMKYETRRWLDVANDIYRLLRSAHT